MGLLWTYAAHIGVAHLRHAVPTAKWRVKHAKWCLKFRKRHEWASTHAYAPHTQNRSEWTWICFLLFHGRAPTTTVIIREPTTCQRPTLRASLSFGSKNFTQRAKSNELRYGRVNCWNLFYIDTQHLNKNEEWNEINFSKMFLSLITVLGMCAWVLGRWCLAWHKCGVPEQSTIPPPVVAAAAVVWLL